jgi:hypothetical protein
MGRDLKKVFRAGMLPARGRRILAAPDLVHWRVSHLIFGQYLVYKFVALYINK